MSGNEEWSSAELVRAIGNLNRTLERLEEAIERVEQDYATKEFVRLVVAPLIQAKDGHSAWVRELVAPLVSGLVVGFVLIAVRAVGGP